MCSLLEIIAEGQQQTGARANRFQRASRVMHQLVGDRARLFQAVNTRIRGFAFIAIAAVRRVQNVVDDLKSKPNAIAVCPDARQLALGCVSEKSSDPNGGADECAGFGSMD